MAQADDDVEAGKILEAYGETGWELVGVIPGSAGSTWEGGWLGPSMCGAWFVFKRGKRGLGDGGHSVSFKAT